MTKTFTQDDVVKYLYNELPTQDKKYFENALLLDQELLDLFNDLSAVKEHLDAASLVPSEKATEDILDYSKSLNLQSLG